jgi:hypothetical protein
MTAERIQAAIVRLEAGRAKLSGRPLVDLPDVL